MMAIALPAAAVIMHHRAWHPIIAIKTFVVGGFNFRFCDGFCHFIYARDFSFVLNAKDFCKINISYCGYSNIIDDNFLPWEKEYAKSGL